MAAILVFTVLLVAALSGMMVYGQQQCSQHLELCGPQISPCCEKLSCWTSTNNMSLPGVCRKLYKPPPPPSGASTVAMKQLSVVVALASIWGLYRHVIP